MTKANQANTRKAKEWTRKLGHSGLYRATLDAKIGKKAIEGKIQPPEGCTHTEYALFCLLSAIGEIAEAMRQDKMENDG